MRAGKHTRRRPVRGVSGPLLTTGLLTAALIATALAAASAAAPAALTRDTTAGAAAPAGHGTPGGAHRDGRQATAPGWRVVATIGPSSQGVTGTLTARSAGAAWSVWTGTRFTAVERVTGTGWNRVPLPARLTAYVRSAVAFDGDSAADFWLFSLYRPTQALRFTGTRWAVRAIPSWVLRASSGGVRRAVTAAFSPRDVWVFSLDAGGYAARWNGQSWTKVRLPGVPDEVSAVAANDIWALDGRVAMHWDGRTWTTSKIPAVAGKADQSFDHLTAAGPESAWVWRTIGPSGPKTDAAVLYWNGSRWRRVAATPADLINSVAPDGSGGLWVSGLDVTPGGFNFFYHLTGGRWTQVSPPAGVWNQQSEYLTWIPGTRSLWGTAAGFASKSGYGVLVKDGP